MVKAEQAAEILNRVFDVIPDALQEIIEHRVPVDFDHDLIPDIDIVVGVRHGSETLSALGLLQGFIDGTVAAVYDESDGRLLRFEVYEPPYESRKRA